MHDQITKKKVMFPCNIQADIFFTFIIQFCPII